MPTQVFFNVFTYKLAVGNPKTVLNAPYSILLSKEKAKKYFGDKNPVGQKLIIDNEDEYTVTGILDDIPLNTQIFCEFLISYNTIDAKKKLAGTFNNDNFMEFQDDYVYILTEPNINIEEISEKMNALVDENVPDHFKPIYDISLIPLKEIYFSEETSGSLEPVGNKKYIWIFLTISGILVLIAAINFMNLSTSRYMHRVKEVGMRKVFGALRKHLIYQFIGESMIITLIALIIGVVTAHLLNPALNNFIGKSLEISFFTDIKLFVFLLFITIFIGFISGSYPAFFLSKFSPKDVFNLNSVNGNSGINLRRVLVIIQFSIATSLVIFTLFIFSQLKYVKSTDLGFNKDNVVILPIYQEDVLPRYETLKNEMETLNNVEYVSCASSFSSSGHLALQNLPLAEGSDENLLVQRMEVDEDYLDVTQIEMIEGRFFSEKFPSDISESIILNETAIKELNLENPVGKSIPMGGEEKRTVIGVIKDFHSQSLKNKINATIVLPIPKSSGEPQINMLNVMGLKIKENQTETAIKAIEAKWKELFPEVDFEYEFLEDAYYNLYSSDIKMSKLFLYFSGLIILISCLGIYGLASFSIEKRVKEIGIRKILGGSLQNISVLLSKQFMIWVIISYIIAVPVVYYFVEKWFRDFAYHIDIGWLQFIIGMILIFIISLSTVLLQTLKAAKANPAEVLRYE
jgi:putative ABC transport system permease protein